MKYKFKGIPDLIRVINENPEADAFLLNSGEHFALLIKMTWHEMSAATKQVETYFCESSVYVVTEEPTAVPSYRFSSSSTWSGLKHAAKGESGILKLGQYLPEGWRLLIEKPALLRQIVKAVRSRRTQEASTQVEVL